MARVHRSLIGVVLACAASFYAGSIGAKEAEPLAADPALESRVMAIAEELRCLVCQNETLAASQADLAIDLRRQIRTQLAEGRSPAQIVDYMVARYGEFVRYRPAFDATTAALWVGPFVLLAIAAVVLGRNIRRRRDGALADAPQLPAGATLRSNDGSKRTAVAVGASMVVFASCVYAAIGNPAAIGALPAPQVDASVDDMNAMLETVAKRLETPGPDPAVDAQGWTMLGRSYAALQRFSDADRAFGRAVALAPADAQLLIDRADVLGALQSGSLAGEPERLVADALRLDPRNLKGLALAGTAAFEHRDYPEARRRWLAARELAPPGSAFAAGLDRSLAEVPADATSTAVATATPAARIAGRVDLSAGLFGRVASDDVVFITARAVDGPPMPLAVLRKRVADLPMDFVLDDSLAMSPDARLSKFARVIVTARVSRSGEAIARADDPRADSAPVDVGATGVQLTVSTPRR